MREFMFWKLLLLAVSLCDCLPLDDGRTLIRSEARGKLATSVTVERHAAYAPEPRSNLTKNMVALVMFDSTYQNLWDCWMDYFQKKSLHQDLHVVVYDKKAAAHVGDWRQQHPNVHFDLQTIIPEPVGSTKMLLNIGGSAEDARWDSSAYESNFWKVILDRLRQGKDVLHMDVDAIAAGDAWEPVNYMLGTLGKDADVINTQKGEIQYMLFRNTPTSHALVEKFAKEWEVYDHLATSGSADTGKLAAARPLEPQVALEAYMKKTGCLRDLTLEPALSNCRLDIGQTIASGSGMRGRGLTVKIAALGNDKKVVQNAYCTEEECDKLLIRVAHGRNNVKRWCPNYDVASVVNHP